MAAMTKRGKTLTAAIKEDHGKMHEYYNHYIKASGNTDAQARWSRQLTWEIARHAVGEEIDKGFKLADEDRNDHQIYLPLLESVLGVEDSKKTASSFRTTKKRPSFCVYEPPYETFLGFLAMPTGKFRDMFSTFPTEEMKEKE
ncbi:uncharacterized protein BT62DRAFT_982950 [Guyanagaster necrorhizus]|uniref:Hemerythrin n=1 Tax=Guyanagaster necrorhizus TaxID=856835 RepID=A0A9P7VHJ6_9AGAR|nr:uncharacterized protein BT62DRAFT_982950 [Guyanagaster necrorhizus MCA 3950]KAG7440829.1 hypothetical protein BT62DRAFT_982950 [Guyanagaster necrorhizus MCA 3950]